MSFQLHTSTSSLLTLSSPISPGATFLGPSCTSPPFGQVELSGAVGELSPSLAGGARYVGSLASFAPSSLGQLTSGTQTYFGEFVSSKRHGIGVLFSPESWFFGQWTGGIKNGIGCLQQSEGDHRSSLEGAFLMDRLHGFAVACNGDWTFQGVWKEGQREGPACERRTRHRDSGQPEVEVFWGTVSRGKRHGPGVLENGTHLHARGTWVEGAMHGFFWIKLQGDTLYKGMLEKDKRTGPGMILSKNGDLAYLGEFKHDLLWGLGKMTKNNTIYIGNWVQGMRQGLGYLQDDTLKQNYFGLWKNGEKNGYGEEYHSRWIYKGMFINGRYDGPGAIYEDDKPVVYVIHDKGKFIRTTLQKEFDNPLKVNKKRFLSISVDRLENMKNYLKVEESSYSFDLNALKSAIHREKVNLKNAIAVMRTYIYCIGQKFLLLKKVMDTIQKSAGQVPEEISASILSLFNLNGVEPADPILFLELKQFLENSRFDKSNEFHAIHLRDSILESKSSESCRWTKSIENIINHRICQVFKIPNIIYKKHQKVKLHLTKGL